MSGLQNNPLKPKGQAKKLTSSIDRAADYVADRATESPAPPPPQQRQQPPAKRSTKVVPASKQQISAYVDRDVLIAARNAQYSVQSEPTAPDNWSEYVTAALDAYTRSLQARLNDGEPYPARPERK
ncbi:hypothetical protein KXR83_26450 [Williamsia muralis]|uniref:hypothetical protein n=1 Tax=Williamsia marianensis TaxID=85044 RepID=UPI003F1549C2